MTRTHATLAQARAWKREIERQVAAGELGAGGRMLLRDASEMWLEAAGEGTAVTRGAAPYRPSTLRGYRQVLERFVWPEIGSCRLDRLTRGDVLGLIGKLRARGCAPATVRNAITPLRAIYRWAADQEWTSRNPTRGIPTAGVSGSRRERFAGPDELAVLLDALPMRDRALWATAMYGGLRLGELQALRWEDVDLEEAVIRVRRAYDARAGRMGPPKSRAGRRDVPIPRQTLLPLLATHERVAELVFARGSLAGATRGHRGDLRAPFAAESVRRRAVEAWRSAGLEPLGLHECRHSYASALLASGASMKIASALLGHGSIGVTIDLYSHLLPSAAPAAVAELDDYLAGPRGDVVSLVGRRAA